MKEGWFGDDYVIVFADNELADAADRYEISQYVQGFQILGPNWLG